MNKTFFSFSGECLCKITSGSQNISETCKKVGQKVISLKTLFLKKCLCHNKEMKAWSLSDNIKNNILKEVFY